MQASRRERILAESILVFLAFVLPATLGAGGETGPSPGISRLLPGVILSAVPQIGLLLYLLAIQGEIRRPELGLRPPSPREAVVSLVLVAVLLGVLAASQLVLSRLPASWSETASRGARIRMSGWAELPVALVLAPLAAAREEFLYRSYLYVRLRDLGVPWAASLAVTSALFAAAHAYQGPLAVGLALIQGLALGGAFIRTRSLGVPVAAHASYNIALLAAGLIPGLTPAP